MIRDYTGYLFVDLLDLRVLKDLHLTSDGKPREITEWFKTFPNCMVKGSRQPLRGGSWEDVRVLSVTYSSVTQTVLNRCPNLEWVMVRGHSYNCIDMTICRSRGIGVSSLGAFTPNCSQYILNHLGQPPYVFYGYGRIPRAAAARLPPKDVLVINTKTSRSDADKYLGQAGTLIASVPIPMPPRALFTMDLFRRCRRGVKFVSICHEPLMDNLALLQAVQEGYVGEAVVDSLWKKDREQLLADKRITWTKDTAWSTNFDYERYKQWVQEAIDRTLAGDFPGILLRPGEKRPQGFTV